MANVKKVTRLVIIGFVVLILAGRAVQAQVSRFDPAQRRRSFRAGELIVKIRDELPAVSQKMTMNIMDTGSRNLNALNQQFGVTDVEPVFGSKAGRMMQEDTPLAHVLLLKLGAEADESAAVRAYASLDEVEYAELNYWYYIFATTNDAFLTSQYSLYSTSYQGINAIGGWDIEQGSDSIIVAVIDTGIDYTHEDLAGKVIKGYDFVNEDFDPMDDNGHGTHVAGIAGATANNGVGIAGVCPGCSLLAIKVITASGSGANSWIANGIANAVNLGARVINMSLGGIERSNTIELAVEQAYQKGVMVVAASGNDGSSTPLYPAAFSEVIAVGATDRYGQRAVFSNTGSHLELAAPGQTIYSTLPGNSYEAWNGTSMACPHVAGLAGLVMSRNPALSNQQVRQVLITSAQDLGAAGRDSLYGYGRINALAALTETPDSGGAYPTPNPDPGAYPTPSPGYPVVCGHDLGGVLVIVMFGLGWVQFARRRR